MRDRTYIKTDVIGTIVAAICCATPVLLLALGAVGLSAWLVWADGAALAALVGFVLLAAYGYWRWRTARYRAPRPALHH